MNEYEQTVYMIEQELYAALEALQQHDLQTVRGCVARANRDVVEAWRIRRQGVESSTGE